MAKFLKITPPTGFPTVVPDSEAVREHYTGINQIRKKAAEKLFRIEKATQEEIAKFHPVVSGAGALTPKTNEIEALKAEIAALKAGAADFEALKAEIEALKAVPQKGK
jgi:hypothetical protein